jgi:catechol 2,3-dioxygenase-like lactoylglutathione lyase family enzyme
MIYELNHIGIFVSDLPRTLAFYKAAFGARDVWETSIESVGIDIAYLQVAGGLLEFIAFRDSSQAPRIDHLGFLTDDLDGDYAAIIAAGYESVIEPRAAGSGVGRQAFVLDGDGTRIELLERESPVRFDDVDDSVVASIDHVSLHTGNVDSTLRFYRDLLGMSLLTGVTVPVTNPKVTYLDLGYDVVQVLTDVPSDLRFDHLAFRVKDVDVALESFKAAGEPPTGPSQPAASGLGRVGSIVDPDGILIEVIDRPGVRDLKM